MRSARSGWSFVGWMTVALVCMSAAVLFAAGTGEAGARMWIRATARTSVVLFTVAFAASSLRQLVPHPWTKWALANRRYFGVAFAVSHGLHLVAIAMLAVTTDVVFESSTLVFGGIASLVVAAMAASSLDRTADWLGPRAWGRLHRYGSWYVWLVFVATALPNTFEAPLAAMSSSLLLGAAGARGIAGNRRLRVFRQPAKA